MTDAIREAIRTIGSEAEGSIATEADYYALAETLIALSGLILNRGMAGSARVKGEIHRAKRLERVADSYYDQLPEGCQW